MPAKRLSNFRNEQTKDFSLPKEKTAMENALKQARANLGKEYPVLIGSERIKTNDFIISRNPAHPNEIVGKFGKGTIGLAQRSLDTAAKTFETWRTSDPFRRADILIRAAAIAKRRRYEINAWM